MPAASTLEKLREAKRAGAAPVEGTMRELWPLLMDLADAVHAMKYSPCAANSLWAVEAYGRLEKAGDLGEECDHGKLESEECPTCEHDRLSDGETDGARL